MERIKRLGGPHKYAILLPIDEWTQPVVFGLQTGAGLLDAGGRHGAFRDPRFPKPMAFYLDLYSSGLAPPLDLQTLANLSQQLAERYFAMALTAPHTLAAFRHPPPADT